MKPSCLQHRPCSLIAVILGLLGVGLPAWGFISVDLPLSRILRDSEQALVAKVTAVDAAKGRVTVTAEKDLRPLRKGEKPTKPSSDTIEIQVDDPKDVLRYIAKGSPTILFVGANATAIHLGDDWLLAERVKPTAFRVTGRHQLTRTFPGRTAALVAILEGMATGQFQTGKGRDSYTAADIKKMGNPLLELFEHSNWSKHRVIASLGVKATGMTAGDVTGDGKPDLLVMTDKGVRLYEGGANQSFKDVTAERGLASAKTDAAAMSDVDGDGKVDLLLDVLWLNTGAKFAKSTHLTSGAGPALASALADVTGDGKPDALMLTPAGTLHIHENPGRADQPWKAHKTRTLFTGGEAPLAAHFGDFGDDGRPHAVVIFANDIIRHSLTDDLARPADYTRLTGHKAEARYFPIKDFLASVAIDVNGGDGRLDLFISTRKGKPGDICLINRGYGAYWPNNEASRADGMAASVALCAADVYGDGSFELLALTATGDLILADSPPYKRGKPTE